MSSPQIPRFIHLRQHSEFSVQDGIIRLDDAVAAAHADSMPALAVTDLMNLFGMVKFYKAARSAGVKPVIGCDVWISQPEMQDTPSRMLLLVKDASGYQRLSSLLTRAYRENQQQGRAELRAEWLHHRPDIDQNNAGLICLSGFHAGEVGRLLLAGNQTAATDRARFWSDQFPGNFYLEVQRYDIPELQALVHASAQLAATLDLPLVATHPVQFLQADDFKAHEARVCISQGFTLSDNRRPKVFTPAQYFKPQAEMAAQFADYPQALSNSVEIAKRCNLTLELGRTCLPDFPVPPGMSLDQYLVVRAKEGLEEKLAERYPDAAQRDAERPRYLERLQFETDTIIQMGYPGYFLIVSDFINWAKHNGCPVGPGRGSGAGSLVAYSLGITDLDPTDYALLFERFLNPERVSMPDFDIDFCQDNRWRVIEYVRKQYGDAAVSQIVTFGTMAAKAVIRDVGRVMDLPYNFVDQLTKLIPNQPGKQFSLDEALEMEPQLKERLEKEEEVGELWILAKKLEGITRNVGMHAGGVLIAPGQLTDFCPLYAQPGSDHMVSQLDKDDVEAMGLVKFDFLGLRNLTIIELAILYVRQLNPDFDTDIERLIFDDPATYSLLQKANTTAVFQLESDGMKKLLAKLKPTRFEDIIAVLALYRPGPLGSGMVDDFVLRKNGKQKIDYFHPDLTACLDPTYGVIVYQEQVMQISQIIGGYTLGGADMLRRAMGKKKPEEMAKHRSIFIDGAVNKGYTQTLAESLFDLMTKFAEYGFNKSHTAAYAVIAYRTAWLKKHYPAAFMAATLSSELDNTDQLRIFFDDTLANGIRFLPPSVNHSQYRFVPVNDSDIRYALGAIKGTGEQAVEYLIAERTANGPYADLFDFCRRVDRRTVNRRTVEALIRAGAFDEIESNRASLLASVGLAIDSADQDAAHAQQVSLFDEVNDPSQKSTLLAAMPWTDIERLQEEKTAIGFYFSGHPFDSYKAELVRFAPKRLAHLTADRGPQKMAGVLMAIRTKMTQRGKMAILTLDDTSAQIDVSLFAEQYENFRDKVKEDRPLIVEGKISLDDYTGGLRVVADQVWTLEEARTRFASSLSLAYPTTMEPAQLLSLLRPYRQADGCPVRVKYASSSGVSEWQLGAEWRVGLFDDLFVQLKKHGIDAFALESR